MPRITVTIPESLDEYLEEESEEDGEFDSKSEVMRHLAERGREADKLERDLNVAENRIRDLERQMGARDHVEEKVDVLANTIEEEKLARDAPFFVKWYRWWQRRGGSGDEDDENDD